ncbi:haloacid dehalogenase-like hydrolase [Candidatus Vidania fulgoroideorum]
MEKKIIVLFDLDHTILNIDSEREFFYFLKIKKIIKINEFNKINENYKKYKKGNLDFKNHNLYVNNLIKSLDKYFINKYIKYLKNSLNTNVLKLLLKHLYLKNLCIITSASNKFIVKKICAKYLNIKKFFSCKNFSNIKSGKLKSLKYWSKKNKFKSNLIYLYSDSFNDIPLFKKSKFKYSINPDRILLKRKINHLILND